MASYILDFQASEVLLGRCASGDECKRTGVTFEKKFKFNSIFLICRKVARLLNIINLILNDHACDIVHNFLGNNLKLCILKILLGKPLARFLIIDRPCQGLRLIGRESKPTCKII